MIDADASVQDSIRTLGEVVGFDVRSYKSAESFLAALPGITSGCIVAEADLPGISGISLFKSLQARGVHLPFALLLSRDDKALRWAALEAGIAQVLEKPRADQALLEFILGPVVPSASAGYAG